MKQVSWICVALAILTGAARAQGRPDRAQVSFVAAGDLAGGAYRAAIVVILAPDTITYWRNPGEAGVPPNFDFSGSENLGRAEVDLPAPTRIDEAGGDVFGYRTRAAYAVTLTPAVAAKPLRAVLKMDYAACARICIPMHAEARLELAPDGEPGPDAPAVEAARAAIPTRVSQDQAATITPVAGANKPSWRVMPKTHDASDLFAEAPDNYFFDTRRIADGSFELTLAERPANATAQPVPVRLTLARPGGGVDFTVSLDAGGRTP